MAGSGKILVTGATGKVGQVFIRRLLASPALAGYSLRALCHNRMLEPQPRLEVIRGSIEHRDVVEAALDGITHVVHAATVKETPEVVMDVSVKGMFWLLETCRVSPTFQQFIQIGGDNSVGHFVYPARSRSPRSTSTTLSGLLRALQGAGGGHAGTIRHPVRPQRLLPARALDHGEGRFQVHAILRGGCLWRAALARAGWRERADEYVRTQTVPVMLDPEGQPVQRNFVHVDDLVSAILAALDNPKARQQLFNICMDEPVNYRAVAEYLAATRGLPSVDVPTVYHSTWLDNTKAKFVLGWRPVYDLPRLIDAAYTYQRAADDPRVIWYPG
jgi:nucleoside-diphosphate-sugar epimerase